MIYGIGNDIVAVKRIAQLIKQAAFLKKIYTSAEINYCEQKLNKAESYAARFAGKEAFMKALGTGWGQGICFVDIEILPNEAGQPILHLANIAKDTCVQMHCHISLSHEKDYAIASVILENKGV